MGQCMAINLREDVRRKYLRNVHNIALNNKYKSILGTHFAI
jgi:hypothetical protein